MAWGPFIVLKIKGIVMNGPTPIISSILAETASKIPSWRCRWGVGVPDTARFSHTFA